jgi:hypothetical protein
MALLNRIIVERGKNLWQTATVRFSTRDVVTPAFAHGGASCGYYN